MRRNRRVVVYLPSTTTRDKALQIIDDEINAIAQHLEKLNLKIRTIASREHNDFELDCASNSIEISEISEMCFMTSACTA